MILRPVTFEDAKMLLVWRNDPETRQQSRNRQEVTWDDHVLWLKRSLSNPRRKLYLAEEAGALIGTVRSDQIEKGVVELSWTIAPAARGKGWGKKMVLEFVREFHPQDQLTATIRKGNIASEKIAQALGLHPESLEDPSFEIWR